MKIKDIKFKTKLITLGAFIIAAPIVWMMLARMEGADPAKAERQRQLAGAAALDSNVDTFQLNPAELAKVRKKMDLAKKAHLKVSGPTPEVVDLARDRTTVGKGSECSVKLDTAWGMPRCMYHL